ncbi:MAG TPA: PHP-associated domain-containing protein [Chloroflexia bacterium]|nr:PHP-associated domain-containing protein [Chloroflexia bacterium]
MSMCSFADDTPITYNPNMTHSSNGHIELPVNADGKPLRIGKADLHMHTALGDGLASVQQIFDYVENYTDLDIIAITDHDDIRGAMQALELIERRKYRFQVIPGNEITTRQGHLLALFVTQEFPMLKSLDWSMKAVHEAGGMLIAPHPMSWLTTSIREKPLLAAHAGPYPFHGIETFNPSYAGRVAHKRVIELNQTVLHLPEFGGSDAHANSMIGKGYTSFPGTTIEDLLQAIKERKTVAGGTFMNLRDHGIIAAPNMWKSMIVHPSYKVRRAVSRRFKSKG